MAASPSGGGGGGGPSLIDTKAYGKLRTFSGKEDDWATWSFVARSYLALLSAGYQDYLARAENAATAEDIALSAQGDQARAHSWTLFNVLVQSVEGRALSVLMNVEQGNGLLAWRLLQETYEPRIGGRWTSMLMGIIGPNWSTVKEEDFLESLESWEVTIRRYEEQSSETVTPAIKCAVVMRFAPKGIQTALRTASSTIGTNYELLKKSVKDFLQSGQNFDNRGQVTKDNQGVAPMEVGAIEKGGKFKGKSKNEFKGDFKGGKKGKTYGKDYKGKQKGVKGKFDKGSKYFEGYCSYCNKYGHKKADCKSRERDREKGKSKGGTHAIEAVGAGATSMGTSAAVYYNGEAEGPEAGVAGPSTPDHSPPRDEYPTWPRQRMQRWSDAEESDEWSEHHGWVAAVEKDGSVGSLEDNEIFVMYDTGSDEHVCTLQFAGGLDKIRQSQVRLNAVSGDALDIIGEVKMKLQLQGIQQTLEIEVVFQVSKNATKNILSGGKLFKAGFQAQLSAERKSNVWHKSSGTIIPLYMKGNSFYLKVAMKQSMERERSSPTAIVAPITEEERWEQAGGEDVDDDPIEDWEGLPDARGGSLDDIIYPLSSASTVKELRERLKYLGWSISGNKQALLSRLRAAEKQEKKMRDRQRAIEGETISRNEDLARAPQTLKVPVGPTETEKAKHNLTHFPTEDWCIHCTKGRAKDNPHRRKDEPERAIIQVDYSYLKSDGSEGIEDAAEVVLTAVDTTSGMVNTMSLPAKNFEMRYAIKTLKNFISQLGHVHLAVRSDGEPTILQLVEGLRDELNASKLKDVKMQVFAERVPRYSSQSLGSVGAQQALLKGDVLTLRSALEEVTGIAIHPGMTIWPWLVRHCGWTRSRFAIKANKRTAFEDAFGHSYSTVIVPFGEVVLFKMPASSAGRTAQKRQLKGDFSWEKGVFLGKMTESDEFLLGSKRGVHAARTVRRLPIEHRNAAEMIKELRGVPWDTMTSIGRPRKPIIELLAQAPKAATAGTIPGGVKVQVERGSSKTVRSELEVKEVLVDKKQRLEEKRVTPSVPMTPTGGAPSSGSTGERDGDAPMAYAEDATMDSEQAKSVEAWRKREATVLERHEQAGSDPKKSKVGGQFVGALFNPTVDDEIPEIDDELVGESYPEEDAESAAPITEAEKLEAMQVEFGKMDKFKTYEVVPEEQARGKTVLDSTWVIVRKPTGVVKARYCLREYKRSTFRDDVYAVATTSATAKIVDYMAVQHGYVCFTGDATNAFWQVPIEEEAYMDPPKEWLAAQAELGLPTNVKWKLLKEWYGRRVAGTRWVEWFALKLKAAGFERCIIAPWFYRHPKGLHAEVHMDDIYGCGPEAHVLQFKKQIEAEVIIKVDIHKPGSKFSHLKRVRHYAEDGRMFIQPDPKHIDAVVKMLGLRDCRHAATPGVPGGSQVEEGRALDEAEKKLFQSATGVLMYISPDRPDCQFSIRELQKASKAPTFKDMTALIRVARYLHGTRTEGIEFRPGGDGTILDVHSDTDWASCKRTRKSTACATIMLGGCLLHAYSRGLSMICLSSGEAEFNGGVAACSEAIFFQAILNFHGVATHVRVWLDSSAARGVFQRQGVGKIRHLEAKSLWVQEGLKRKQFELRAVGTEENTADIGTKALNEAKLQKHKQELKIWSEEVFLAGKVTQNGVNAVEAMQQLVRFASMLGMSQLPGAWGKETEPGEAADWSWTELGIGVSLAWMLISFIVLMGWIILKVLRSFEAGWEKGASGDRLGERLVVLREEPGVSTAQGLTIKAVSEESDSSAGLRRDAGLTQRGKWPRQVDKIIICKYGKVAHLSAGCGRLKSSRGVNQQAYPICAECARALSPG